MNVDQKINLRAFRGHWEKQTALARIPYGDKAKPRKVTAFNQPFARNNSRSAEKFFWVENCEATGLRLVGFADDLNKHISHKGWFLRSDDWGGETYRGIVYRLPARDGKNVYLIGYADPFNADCALLSTELHYEDAADDFNDAASAANHVAEIFAEDEREYNDAWGAVQIANDAAKEARDEARNALECLRQLEKCDGPAIQKKVRADWCEAWEAYREKMAALVEALDNPQGITLADF